MSGQGADELRVKGLLIRNGVGPEADLPPTGPAKPAPRPRDWLDDILDANATPPAAKPRPVPEKADTNGAAGDAGEQQGDDSGPGEDAPPPWDPVAIADRMARAYQDRSVGERLRNAAQVVVHSRARFGQLFFTASGVWVAWRIGFTPWLVHFTADAPLSIPLVGFGIGWAINRRLDATALPFAWMGRAIYTATLIALVLHP